MQRRIRIKNIRQRLGRDNRVHVNAGTDILLQIIKPLDHDQRAMIFRREQLARLNQIRNDLSRFARERGRNAENVAQRFDPPEPLD